MVKIIKNKLIYYVNKNNINKKMSRENMSYSIEEILFNLKHTDNHYLPYEVIVYLFKNKEELKNLDEKLITFFPEIRIIIDTDDDLCLIATSIGSLNLLRVAHENGFTWEDDLPSRAAFLGHVKCLEYAVENGCDVDSCTIYSDALKGGHRDCFKYVAKMCGLKNELDEMHNVVEYE
jgi:hypothetical protein